MIAIFIELSMNSIITQMRHVGQHSSECNCQHDECSLRMNHKTIKLNKINILNVLDSISSSQSAKSFRLNSDRDLNDHVLLIYSRASQRLSSNCLICSRPKRALLTIIFAYFLLWLYKGEMNYHFLWVELFFSSSHLFSWISSNINEKKISQSPRVITGDDLRWKNKRRKNNLWLLHFSTLVLVSNLMDSSLSLVFMIIP